MRSDSQRACACGRHYDGQRWEALPVFARLTAEDVSSIVARWPSHLVIEVRVCTNCQRAISRLRTADQKDVNRPQTIAA
jgi:hypothetical protein